MKIRLRGTVMRMTKPPSMAQAVRQPRLSMITATIGMMAAVPSGRPMPAIAMARPRLAWNHFATGTVVMSWPIGAPKPVRPERANRA